MLDLHAELARIVDALDQAGVAYALVGGVAVSIYTAPRATEDIDLMVAVQDVERAVAALIPLGFRRAGQRMEVAGARLAIHRLIKIAGPDLLPLDLLVPLDPALAAPFADRTPVCQADAGPDRADRRVHRGRGHAVGRLQALDLVDGLDPLRIEQ